MMDSKQEKISALIDGQLESEQIDALLQELAQDDARADWDVYHRIGNLLRAEDEVNPGADFSARMAARLAQEAPHRPALAAAQTEPAVQPAFVAPSAPHAEKRRRWTLASLAAAGGALLASLGILGTQQVMLAQNSAKPALHETRMAAHNPQAPVVLLASAGGSAPKAVPTTSSGAACVEKSERVIANGKAEEMVMLRDPEIDQYLMAHQRYSNSLHSAAQYARSANFAADAQK
ncbi:sigma-E factor negative regulatory protein [Massilia sp. W12]|uniref:sigma-E factor negative regulatory protein n=1 Tax=Massilia sp. W12 TaxID=3126507 RepID=UPI0030D34B2D